MKSLDSWSDLPPRSLLMGQTRVIFIYLVGVLRRFQHCTGHIMTGIWESRGNQYILLVKTLYCKLPTNSKQLPAFPLKVGPETKPRSQRWEARVLPLCCHKIGNFVFLPYTSFIIAFTALECIER